MVEVWIGTTTNFLLALRRQGRLSSGKQKNVASLITATSAPVSTAALATWPLIITGTFNVTALALLM
jgi:hypothetical protein